MILKMKKLYISVILALGAAMGFTSCDDLFEQAQENLKDRKSVV